MLTEIGQIYSFLIKLPAHDHVMENFENESASYKDAFPIGESFKCLYATYALKEYVHSVSRRSSSFQPDSDPGTPKPESYESALKRLFSVVAAAITDPDVIEKCPTKKLRLLLSHRLVEILQWMFLGTK